MSTTGQRPSENLFQKIAFLLFLGVISAGFLYMVRAFLITLLLAGVFTGLTRPVYDRLLRVLRKPALTSLATLLLLLLVLVLPAGAVITVAYHEAVSFIGAIDFASLPRVVERLAGHAKERLPYLFSHVHPQDVSRLASQGLQQALQFSLQQGAAWSVQLAGNVANFFMMLFMMFYFYMDGRQILKRLTHWSPLRDDYQEVLLQKFRSVSRATLKGILVVGIIQGALGTLLYWLVGLKAAVFLGVLMIFCSILPVVGTSIVWIPTAVILFFQGRIVSGIAVAAVGVLVISVVDNLLRPMLVGKDIKMHDLLVLLSTLGGLGLFGLPGFIIGPVLASLFLSIWNMYEEVFAAELARPRSRANL
jgi:predicted PurR-regulated permease PerM